MLFVTPAVSINNAAAAWRHLDDSERAAGRW
jgi:hypothetical protein